MLNYLSPKGVEISRCGTAECAVIFHSSEYQTMVIQQR